MVRSNDKPSDNKNEITQNNKISTDHPRMEELRAKVMEYIEENEGVFHPDDVELLKTDNLWINRFLNFLDQPFDKAFNHLIETFKWRKQEGIHSFDKNMFSIECWLCSTAFIYLPDREGRPILYVRVKNHLKGDPHVNDLFRKFLLLLIDLIDRLAHKEEGYNVFLDLTGMSLKNLDLDMLQYLIEVTRYKYVGGCKYCFVHGLPFILNFIVRSIAAALPSDTGKKVKFINGTHHRELDRYEVTSNFSKSIDLNNNDSSVETNEIDDKKRTKLHIEEYIDINNLPSFLGGRATLNERIMPRNAMASIFKVGTTIYNLSEEEMEKSCKPFQTVIDDARNTYKTFRERSFEFEFDMENIVPAYKQYYGL